MILKTPAVVCKDLCMAYGTGKSRVRAIVDVSMQIRQGGITGLMGPDASGKTTLMRIMAGLLLPDGGSMEIFGETPQELLKRQPNSIGYMPQRFGLYEDLTVMGNLDLYASLRGVTGDERHALFQKLLGFTALGPFTGRLAGNLSGGMKQKLGIACALMGNPRLLLLDEPGVGVDPRSRRELWEMVGKLAQDGMTVVWATSYLDEAEKCPQLIMLNGGSVLFSGEPRALTERARGRVFLLADAGGGQAHRKALSYWMERPGIIDALIQGRFMRLMTGGDSANKARTEILEKGGKATEPRLEDAYLAAVGGIDKRPSPFAEIGHIGSASNADSRVVANGLTKKFGNFTAAHDISFRVSSGEIVGLLGPNGAGKSTTFRMLCGLLRPTSGDCSVDGVDMLGSSSLARSRLGYMAQKFSLYPDIRVAQNISIFANLYGLSRERIKNFVPQMASALDLKEYLRSPTGSLPLGLKQRLALLCATMHEPPVLFLDEPTSGVDVRTRRDFWKHISALTAAGAAVLVTTHFMEEAEYCDRIALIYRGCMIQFGSPDELKAKVTDVENPTMEDAFIDSINRYDREHPL